MSVSIWGNNEIIDEGTCFAYSYHFDRSGRIVKHDPPLVGTGMVYKYDSNGELLDYGWDNRDGKEYFWHSTNDSMSEETFKSSLVEISAEHKQYLNHRFDRETSAIKMVSNFCANTDGYYMITPVAYHNNDEILVVELSAHLLEVPRDSFLRKGERRSPITLTILIDYKLYE